MFSSLLFMGVSHTQLFWTDSFFKKILNNMLCYALFYYFKMLIHTQNILVYDLMSLFMGNIITKPIKQTLNRQFEKSLWSTNGGLYRKQKFKLSLRPYYKQK